MNTESASFWFRMLGVIVVCFGVLGWGQTLDDNQLQEVIAGADARREVMIRQFLANPPSATRNIMWDYTDRAPSGTGSGNRCDN